MSEQIIVQELDTATDHKIGIITLNAKSRLNALDREMVSTLYNQLKAWQQDSHIVCIFIQGAGEKALCAGGDIKEIRHSVLTDNTQKVQDFFSLEYQLDYLIHTYSKPIICWGNGIVMGGGIGLMSGTTFRIVTDTTLMAMPEISIGLYPDVGGSWVLGRMPAHVGLFIALTACHLNAADALYLGLGNRFIDQAFRKKLINSLQNANWSFNAYSVTYDVVQKYVEKSAGWLPYSKIRDHRDTIQKIMEKQSLVEIMSSLNSYETDDEWLITAKNNALSSSPLSIYLAYEQLQRCKYSSLIEVFQSELILTYNTVMKGDFCEGVRALLIDKDKLPNWRYKKVSDISLEQIEPFFISPWKNQEHPLKNLGH